jgi:hypothetical protein
LSTLPNKKNNILQRAANQPRAAPMAGSEKCSWAQENYLNAGVCVQ